MPDTTFDRYKDSPLNNPREREQLKTVCLNLGIRCNATFGHDAPPEGFTPGTNSWRVTLRFQGRQLTVPFFTGPAISKEPTAADVLSCLVSDVSAGEQTFEDFASEFGYDVDSRKAEKTWRQCVKMAPRVRRFLGTSEVFERVQNAEH